MATPFIGEVKMVSFNFEPKGWAFCNGQLLPINQNQALFSILGTTYGGNGTTTFALPNLQGRVPLHMGNGFNARPGRRRRECHTDDEPSGPWPRSQRHSHGHHQYGRRKFSGGVERVTSTARPPIPR